MADLHEILGTLLSSISHARRLADVEAAAIAEFYRQHDLLADLAIPRIRVPEMVIDLPLIVDSVGGGGVPAGISKTSSQIVTTLRDHLVAVANEVGIAASSYSGWIKAFKADLEQRVSGMQPDQGRYDTDAVTDAAVEAYETAVADEQQRRGEPSTGNLEPFTDEQIDKMRDALWERAQELGEPGEPGDETGISASILTSDVKDKAGPDSVARFKLVLREEGLEWATLERPDGTVVSRLQPE